MQYTFQASHCPLQFHRAVSLHSLISSSIAPCQLTVSMHSLITQSLLCLFFSPTWTHKGIIVARTKARHSAAGVSGSYAANGCSTNADASAADAGVRAVADACGDCAAADACLNCDAADACLNCAAADACSHDNAIQLVAAS